MLVNQQKLMMIIVCGLIGCVAATVDGVAQEPPKPPAMTVPEAIAALNAPQALTQQQAAITLVEAGAKAKDAVPVVIDILQREWPDVNTDLLFVLLAIGPDAKEALPVLIKVSGSENFHARYLACRVLGKLGESAKPAVPTLIDRLGDEIPSVRRLAAEALGLLGPKVAPEAAEPLFRTMDDRLVPVRENAILALANFGPLAEPAIPKLRTIMLDRNSTLRAAACLTVWKVTNDADAVLPVLKEILREGDFEWEAAQVLGQLGPAAKSAVPELIAALQKDESVQLDAADALGRIGADAAPAIPALKSLLEHEEEEVRDAARKAIEQIEKAAAGKKTD